MRLAKWSKNVHHREKTQHEILVQSTNYLFILIDFCTIVLTATIAAQQNYTPGEFNKAMHEEFNNATLSALEQLVSYLNVDRDGESCDIRKH